MKKHLYLMPVLALSLASFALAGCDDKKEDQTAEIPAAESTMPAADATTATTDMTEAAIEATIHVSDARAFATSAGSTNGAVFLTLHNPQSEPDFLSGATTDVATSVEIHQSYSDPQTGAMQMRATSGVDIGAGQSVTLDPNGYHIMLLGLTAPLTEGQSFNVTLSFRNAGNVVVPVAVVAAGTPSAATTDGISTTDTTPAEAPAESISGDEEVEAPVVTPDAATTTEPATTAPAETTTTPDDTTVTP